jgi:[1-hydroxy-2-(trimethylamino)ethyl]phosphonate dioxygenase
MLPTLEFPQLHKLIICKGHQSYGGESVSQAEHALQCATLARRAGETESLIVASLLHDVGHQLDCSFSDDIPGEDRQHEVLGAQFLCDFFPASVTQPILLHVRAKRYLCAVRPSYFEMLSPASVHSLQLQGGPLTLIESQQFEQMPFFEDAIKLREFDELAKDPAFQSDPWASFEPEMSAMAQKKTP